MFFNRLGSHTVSAQPSFSPRQTTKQRALLQIAAAMALPVGMIASARVQAAEPPPAAPSVNIDTPAKAPILADAADMSDADRLKLGQQQLKDGKYDDAVTTLQMVKRDALGDADKKSLDDALSDASADAKQRSTARAEFDKGQEALQSGDLNAANEHFKAAKENQYADSATTAKAEEQLAVVQKQMQQSGVDAKSLYKKGRSEYRSGDWIAARKDLSAAKDAGYKPGLFEPSPGEMLSKMDAKEKADAAKNAQAQAPAAEESAKPTETAANPTPAPGANPGPATAPSAAPVAAADTNNTTSAAPAPTTAPSDAAAPTTAPSEAAAPAPAEAAAPAPANTKAEARSSYLKGREEYRKGDWIAARQDLSHAKELNYKPGLFEDSPTKYLARMDAKENADAAKALAEANAKAKAAVPAPEVATTEPATEPVASTPNPAPAPAPAPEAVATTGPTVPAPTVPAPTVQPTTGPEAATAPAEGGNVEGQLRATAQLEQIRKDANAYKARQLVDAADQARREGRDTEALNDYGQAYLLDPTNDAARQGRQQLMEAQGLTEGNANRLSEEVRRDRDIRRDKVNQLVTQYLDTANADIQAGKYDDAGRQIDLARTAVATDNTIFTRDELNGFTARIDAVDRTRAAAAASAQAGAITKQQQAAAASIAEQQRRAREEQERTIHDLIAQTQQLIHDARYEQAMGTLDHILNIDPQNDYARGVKPLVQEKAILQQQRGYRELFDLQLERTLNAAQEKMVPYSDILKYPPNWPDISEIRDASVRAERGIKEEDQTVRNQLDHLLPEINFNGNAFGDVVDFLRDVTGANIFVNWRALETAGINKEAPVTARLKNVKFSKALNTILSDVGGGTVKLSYTIDEGVITISTQDDLSKSTAVETYDIRDLLVDVPDFTDSPDLSLLAAQTSSSGTSTTPGQAGGGTSGGGGGNNAGQNLFGQNGGNGSSNEKQMTRQERVDSIIKLIEETVDANSWRDNGGQVGAVKELSGQLIVTQTNENQAALVSLLEKLRESRAIEITVEARFLQVSRHYLEDVGLDLDFFFNTQNPNHFSTITATQSSATFTQNPSTSVPGSLGAFTTPPQALTLQGTYLDNFQVNLLLRATEATVRSSELTAPRMTLFNGQRAYVLFANEQWYIGQLIPIVGNGAVAFEPIPQLLTVGAKLDVQATVSSDRKYVTLTLQPQQSTLVSLGVFSFQQASSAPISTIGGTVTQGAGTAFIQEPNINLQEVKTTVSVPDGGTLLLGGQTQSGEIENEVGVPVLSKIPILKRLFTNRSQAKDDIETLILVRPTIIIQREAEQAQFPTLSSKVNGAQ